MNTRHKINKIANDMFLFVKDDAVTTFVSGLNSGKYGVDAVAIQALVPLLRQSLDAATLKAQGMFDRQLGHLESSESSKVVAK